MNFWSSDDGPDKGGFFNLGASVGPGQPNRRQDVIKVETILGNTGDHDLSRTDGPTGYWSPDKENAVKGFQRRNGLKIDGLLNPNGPTITGLKQKTGPLLGGFAPPGPDEVDRHQSLRMQGEPGLLNTRPARLSFAQPKAALDLDEQSQVFNSDSARALTRSSIDGDIPRIYGDFAKQAGAAAHPALMDLAEQMNAQVGRDRTDRVMHGIIKQLPADQARELLGGAVPAERPLGVKTADLSDDHDQPLFRAAADQYAKADTGTMNDAAPDVLSPPAELPQGTEKPANDGGGSKPVQTAMAPAVAAGAVALGGLTAGILGEKLPEAMEKTRKWWENQTTTVDPEAGKPQVLTCPDPSKPQIPQAIPPSTPPQSVPPVPPSTAQKPPSSHETLPAEPPRKPDVYEIRSVDPIDHDKGGKPHIETQKGLDKISDPKQREVVSGVILPGGVTNGADAKATNIESQGTYDTAKQQQVELIKNLGVDPKEIKPFGNGKPGYVGSTPDGRITVNSRPSSSHDKLPTLEVQVKDENDKVIYTVKRRYRPTSP